jgi:hypothetical protein
MKLPFVPVSNWLPDHPSQAITGVMSPAAGEARVREVWPSVAKSSALAGLGKTLTRTILLAPLAWAMMALFYFGKVLPFVAIRYTLTNRRIMIRRGWTGKPTHETALADIDDVRVVTDGNSDFFRAGDLEIISKGRVVLRLGGVPEPESYRHAILNTRNAWVPGKAATMPFISAAAGK